MKKKSSIALIIASLTLVAGLIIYSIAFFITGGLFSFGFSSGSGLYIQHFGIFDTPWSVNASNNNNAISGGLVTDSLNISDFKSIEVVTSSADVNLIPSDENKIEYSLSENTKLERCDVVGDTLKIKTKNRGGITFFGFGFIGENEYINVYYKEEGDFRDFRDIEISTTSGFIEYGNISADKIGTQTTSGDINVSSVSAKKIALSSVSGYISAETMTAKDTLTMAATSGNLILKDSTANKISCTTVSGEFDISDIEAFDEFGVFSTSGSADIKGLKTQRLTSDSVSGNRIIEDSQTGSAEMGSTSGRIHLSGKIEGETKLSAVSGDIKVTTSLPISDYMYSTSSVSGGTYINDQSVKGNATGNGAYTLEANTTSGGIHFNFGE